MKKLEPVYFALDFSTGNEALDFLKTNRLRGIPVKVGMELFYREGPDMINRLKEDGHAIFLDLKLHDIPETVKRSMRNLAALDIDVVNVHAQGGTEMMRAARKGLMEGTNSNDRPLLFAVTVLTSSDEHMLQNELGLSGSLNDTVRQYSKLTEDSGLDGVVCSVHEAGLVKQATSLYTLTPGIRLVDGHHHDQKRVATPRTARTNGSDSIVVGRAIRDAENPLNTYQTIKEEWEHAIHHTETN